MKVTEMIENLQAFKERWGDLEVFIPEVKEYDNCNIRTVNYHDCRVFASSAMRDKMIVVVDKEGDRAFDYKR